MGRRNQCGELLLALGKEERDSHSRLVHRPHLARLGHLPAAAHLIRLATRLGAACLRCLGTRTPLAPAAAAAAEAAAAAAMARGLGGAAGRILIEGGARARRGDCGDEHSQAHAAQAVDIERRAHVLPPVPLRQALCGVVGLPRCLAPECLPLCHKLLMQPRCSLRGLCGAQRRSLLATLLGLELRHPPLQEELERVGLAGLPR